MSIERHADNLIIAAGDVRPSMDGYEVIGVFNAGVSRLGDEAVLLLRIAEKPINADPDCVFVPVYDPKDEQTNIIRFQKNDPEIDFADPRLVVTKKGTYLTSISHLRLARSSDGIQFTIDDVPFMAAKENYETFGLEDPRITIIDGTFNITYVAVSDQGVATALASTIDFQKVTRHGIIFCPDNKDVVLFPEKVNSQYHALHRPSSPLFETQNLWIASSPDLVNWGNHICLCSTREGFWDEMKIGAGAPPFKTDKGFVEIYHGADRDNRYCLGALLLDLDDPSKIIARSELPLFEPEADYETKGFFGNVVFTCGLLYEERILKIYYGAADTAIACVTMSIDDVFRNLRL